MYSSVFYCVNLLVNSYYNLFLLEFAKMVLIYDSLELDILNQQIQLQQIQYCLFGLLSPNLIDSVRIFLGYLVTHAFASVSFQM